MPGNEPRILGCAAHNLVTVLTELSRLQTDIHIQNHKQAILYQLISLISPAVRSVSQFCASEYWTVISYGNLRFPFSPFHRGRLTNRVRALTHFDDSKLGLITSVFIKNPGASTTDSVAYFNETQTGCYVIY